MAGRAAARARSVRAPHAPKAEYNLESQTALSRSGDQMGQTDCGLRNGCGHRMGRGDRMAAVTAWAAATVRAVARTPAPATAWAAATT